MLKKIKFLFCLSFFLNPFSKVFLSQAYGINKNYIRLGEERPLTQVNIDNKYYFKFFSIENLDERVRLIDKESFRANFIRSFSHILKFTISKVINEYQVSMDSNDMTTFIDLEKLIIEKTIWIEDNFRVTLDLKIQGDIGTGLRPMYIFSHPSGVIDYDTINLFIPYYEQEFKKVIKSYIYLKKKFIQNCTNLFETEFN